MARPESDPERIGLLQADLKQLVTRLTEAELLLVLAWAEDEIRLARSPALRLVRTPSSTAAAPGTFNGSSWELMGVVRRQIHELAEDHLVVLSLWVRDRLANTYGIEA